PLTFQAENLPSVMPAMYVDLPPKWIQRLGFILVVFFGSGSINGLLANLDVLNSNQVSRLYQGNTFLPVCSFFFGMGLAMYLTPRLIYYHNRKNR
ncbi:MAG: hypothetical protein F6K09_34650, partial [Merismopedia sp. SIO2A8]|nr:hypothetical protein [Merismopedia sp. SIO2A8]